MGTRVAAVQLEFQYFTTPQEFADHMRTPVEQAVAAGAELILLPQNTSLGLFGMFDLIAEPSDSLAEMARRQDTPIREWLAERAEYVFEFYLHLFQSLAARVEAWLVPGTVLEPTEQGMFSTAFVMNPAGEVFGRQRKLRLSPAEAEWGIAAGDSIHGFDTEVGNLGVLIGEDLNGARVQAAAKAGAQILLHPSAGQTADLRALVSAANAFGVRSTLTRGGHTERATIYAPLALTPNASGILAVAENDEDAVLIAELDLARLVG